MRGSPDRAVATLAIAQDRHARVWRDFVAARRRKGAPRASTVPGGDHGCTVSTHHGPRARPTDRCVADPRSAHRRDRGPEPGIHHSDRGSQRAAQACRALLSEHGLVGSMGRRGNPCDNAMMESFLKTQKGRGRLSLGLRERRLRCRAPAALHRQLQREATSTWPSAISAPTASRRDSPATQSKPA